MNSFTNTLGAYLIVSLAFGFISLLGGCGIADKATTESTSLDYGPQVAILDGVYAVGTNPTGETIPARTVCASDGSRPLLSASVASQININQLLKFGELTANSMTVTIKGSTITKVWTRTATLSSIFPGANTAFPSGTTTCTATWTGTIATNISGVLQENGSYQVTWSPADCEFEVHNYSTAGGSAGTGAWIPTKYFTTMFVTTAATTKQDAWNVTGNGSPYTLTVPDSVANAQTQYSCADGSKAVKMVWVRQP